MSRATIEAFYAHFARLDGAAMQACYAPDATFDDAVFSLTGAPQIGGMWRMLCDATKGTPQSLAHWKLFTRQITDRSAHWEAHYLFSATGRSVINRIDAEFTFGADGLITRHHDRFDFWAWSRQALGTPGLLLGWSPFLRNKVRKTAAANLQRYLVKGART
ncbi:MAG: nuclear transport factor 2 family protein [Rubrivivax sp.]|nr:nuclear transport factor 2 family protein [Rubrivivax sp.]MDP3613231.1 nuclear transport factor 2 family protein [Rubrivivax sp.]